MAAFCAYDSGRDSARLDPSFVPPTTLGAVGDTKRFDIGELYRVWEML